jgi:hypothetical protein
MDVWTYGRRDVGTYGSWEKGEGRRENGERRTEKREGRREKGEGRSLGISMDRI